MRNQLDAQQAITVRDKKVYQKVFGEKGQASEQNSVKGVSSEDSLRDDTLTDADFKATLIANIMREPALWEHNYDLQNLSETQRQIFADLSAWAEQYDEIIQTSKMVVPTENFMHGYGYLAEAAGHGFIYLRNPSDLVQQFNLKELLGNGRIQLLEILSGARRDILSGTTFELQGLDYLIYQF